MSTAALLPPGRATVRIPASAAIATLLLLAPLPAGAAGVNTATAVAALPSGDAANANVPSVAPAPQTELQARLEASGGVIAGERLHMAVLREFYGKHNYQPVWSTHQAQADALTRAVSRASEHGLDPNLFHAAALANAAGLSPNDRDILLSDSFLAFADALARGAVPIEARYDDEDLKSEPVDVALELDRALQSPDPAAIIEALAPQTPEYKAMQQALRAYRSGTASEPAPAAGRGQQRSYRGASYRPAAYVNNDAHLRQIMVNMERLRWLPRSMPADRVVVNTANASLVLYRDNRPVFTTRVVVGETDKQTPEVQATISSVLFNPPWNVPRSIAAKEIYPKLNQDPDYLAKHHMIVRHNGLIQQLPGEKSALGQIKFEMPNRFDVYLHDTPLKNLFSSDSRRRSHGCVRVQNPRELGALLLQRPIEVINQRIGLGHTNSLPLPEPVPVFFVYHTAFVDQNGALEFRPDFYQRDDEIWQHLRRVPEAPIAQGELAGQRRG